MILRIVTPGGLPAPSAIQFRTETAMTLNLTPRLTISIRKAEPTASHVVRTQTRRLSITAVSFLNLELMVFKYHGK